MFERFSERARKVMSLANQSAQSWNHEYIGTEHILLGLIKEGTGVGSSALNNLGVDTDAIQHEVEKLVKPGSRTAIIGKLPQTPLAKQAIEYAIEEARKLNHNYVGTEHLLLGLLRVKEGVADQVLINLGLELETVREAVLNLLGNSTAVAAPAKGPDELMQCAIEYLQAAKEHANKEGDDERTQQLLEHIERLCAIVKKIPKSPANQKSTSEPISGKMGTPCPNKKCGHWNERLARFCSQCGRNLTGEKAPEPESKDTPHTHQLSVTQILIAMLVGMVLAIIWVATQTMCSQ